MSPIVHGQAIKGPLAAMIPGLAGVAASAAAVAAHYPGLAAMVVEQGDAVEGVRTLETRTVMRSVADSEALARDVLEVATRVLSLRG